MEEKIIRGSGVSDPLLRFLEIEPANWKDAPEEGGKMLLKKGC